MLFVCNAASLYLTERFHSFFINNQLQKAKNAPVHSAK